MKDEKIKMLSDHNVEIHLTPRQVLEEALRCVDENEGVFGIANKLVIIALNDNKQYATGFIQAGMNFSEMVALLTIVSGALSRDMGY